MPNRILYLTVPQIYKLKWLGCILRPGKRYAKSYMWSNELIFNCIFLHMVIMKRNVLDIDKEQYVSDTTRMQNYIKIIHYENIIVSNTSLISSLVSSNKSILWISSFNSWAWRKQIKTKRESDFLIRHAKEEIKSKITWNGILESP